MKTVEVFEVQPKLFSPKVEIAGCYVEKAGELLLLQNAANDSEPGKWGIPAGKMEQGEDQASCAARELFEETSIVVDPIKIVSMGALYVRKPTIDYVFHLFLLKLEEAEVHLSSEHVDYRWVSPEEIGIMRLMEGGKEAYYKYRAYAARERARACVSAYLILKREDQILLQLRINTGYCDGMWGFVAGHVEDGEPVSAGLIREVREEIGIELGGFKPVHVMHRKTSRLNIDVFFECLSWTGKIENREVEKCAALQFFSLHALPENLIEYNAFALQSIAAGSFYSEYGWKN